MSRITFNDEYPVFRKWKDFADAIKESNKSSNYMVDWPEYYIMREFRPDGYREDEDEDEWTDNQAISQVQYCLKQGEDPSVMVSMLADSYFEGTRYGFEHEGKCTDWKLFDYLLSIGNSVDELDNIDPVTRYPRKPTVFPVWKLLSYPAVKDLEYLGHLTVGFAGMIDMLGDKSRVFESEIDWNSIKASSSWEDEDLGLDDATLFDMDTDTEPMPEPFLQCDKRLNMNGLVRSKMLNILKGASKYLQLETPGMRAAYTAAGSKVEIITICTIQDIANMRRKWAVDGVKWSYYKHGDGTVVENADFVQFYKDLTGLKGLKKTSTVTLIK